MKFSSLDSPNVRVPPPLAYAGALAGGYVLERIWSVPILTGEPVQWLEIAGLVLIAVFVALAAPAMWSFWRAKTGIIPIHPATTLVVKGPYRLTRNPMYLGLTALTLGVSLLMNSWWPVLLLPLAVLLIDRFVIRREERYLESKFGEAYRSYCARVRRWL